MNLRNGLVLSALFLAVTERERSEEHTSELQSQSNLVCRLLLEKKKKKTIKEYQLKNYALVQDVKYYQRNEVDHHQRDISKQLLFAQTNFCMYSRHMLLLQIALI